MNTQTKDKSTNKSVNKKTGCGCAWIIAGLLLLALCTGNTDNNDSSTVDSSTASTTTSSTVMDDDTRDSTPDDLHDSPVEADINDSDDSSVYGVAPEQPEIVQEVPVAPDPDPAPAPAYIAPEQPSSGGPTVKPGSFCSKSQLGAIGYTTAGTPMTCSIGEGESRARWR